MHYRAVQFDATSSLLKRKRKVTLVTVYYKEKREVLWACGGFVIGFHAGTCSIMGN